MLRSKGCVHNSVSQPPCGIGIRYVLATAAVLLSCPDPELGCGRVHLASDAVPWPATLVATLVPQVASGEYWV